MLRQGTFVSYKDSMIKEIKVSVVISVYNIEKYVSQCLESVLNQSYKNIEVIIINDGSTDNSRNVCSSFAYDKRVKIINQNNQGLVSSRQNGLKEASGDYLLFIDGDDWLDIQAIQRMVDPILKNSKIDMTICNFSFDYPTKVKRNPWHLASGIYDRKMIKNQIIKELIYPRVIPSSICCKLIKKELAEEILKVDKRISIGEDTAATTFLVIKSNNIYILDSTPLYHYRQNDESMTKVYKKDYWRKTVILYKNIVNNIFDSECRLILQPQLDMMLITFSFSVIDNEFIYRCNNTKDIKKILYNMIR